MLETRGYRVLAFSDAQQALNRFTQGGVDLVLTDLIMPGIDGSKLVQSVKGLSPETPAILLSGKVKIYEQETGADVLNPPAVGEKARAQAGSCAAATSTYPCLSCCFGVSQATRPAAFLTASTRTH